MLQSYFKTGAATTKASSPHGKSGIAKPLNKISGGSNLTQDAHTFCKVADHYPLFGFFSTLISKFLLFY